MDYEIMLRCLKAIEEVLKEEMKRYRGDEIIESAIRIAGIDIKTINWD